MSWAHGSFVHVTLVSSVENYSVPANWNTTWMYVLIRSLRAFSKVSLLLCPWVMCWLFDLSSQILSLCWGQTERKAKFFFSFFFHLPSQPLTNLNILIYTTGRGGQFPLKYLCSILAAIASQFVVARRWRKTMAWGEKATYCREHTWLEALE